MKKISYLLATFFVLILVVASSAFNISAAQAEQIDVSYLQTCLKDEGSSLDVLVLMDSSASLRDAKPSDGYKRKGPATGSDPERKRGKILKSSLKILRSLADDSERTLNLSLRNFGNNSNPAELAKLQEKWISWTDQTSDQDLNRFVEQALYDDSTMTEWANGLSTAKNQFKERIGKAQLAGTKSCSIMFWITDGAPTDSTESICAANTNSSISWFRENHILVLGGLLQPPPGKDRLDAGKFKPIIEGENCGEMRPGWTRGEVIEANDINTLAWEFVGLIASIKNLINLNSLNSSFYVDPGTSHIELFIRGEQGNWQVNKPDGSTYCSSSNLDSRRCLVKYDAEIGITTITVYPENPAKGAGSWSLSPKIEDANFQVYGGLNTTSPGSEKTKPKLVVTSSTNYEVEEGKDATFQVRIVNADGTEFSKDGYKSIEICAKLESVQSATCKSGNASASLTVNPVVADKNVGFEAVLVSAHSVDRDYRIPASVRINVTPSGLFPSLKCQSDPCLLENLANKNDTAVSTLEVKAAENGSAGGKVSLISYTVLSDQVQDRNFVFKVQKASDQSIVNWNAQSDYLVPGDKILLAASTDLAGDSEVQGVIKYKVVADGKEITRQLGFKFNVGHKTAGWLQFALLLLAYLVTVGLPYLYLLWSARRAAVLNVPDGEYSFLVLPFEITKEGKLMGLGEIPAGATFAPNHKNLEKRSIAPNTRNVTIDLAEIATIPPKWNPFSDVKTTVSIPGNYVLPTCSDQSLNYESARFISTLVDEAIIYFPAEGNIAPLHFTSEETVVEEAAFDVYESTYESKISNTISVPTRAVAGNVIFIVPPYGNKEKSLIKVLNNLNAVTSNVNWLDKIAELREVSLKFALEEQEKKKAIEEIEQAKKIGKAKVKTEKVVEKDIDEGWSTSSSETKWDDDSFLRSEPQEMPDSWKNDDPW